MNTRTKQNLTIDTIKEMIDDLKENMMSKMEYMVNDVKNSIEFMSKKFDEVMKEVSYVKEENKKLKKEIFEIKKQSHNQEEKVIDLEKAHANTESMLDQLEQYTRRSNLEFHGVPFLKNKNTTFLIKKLVKKMNIELEDNHISISHRLPSRLKQTSTSDENIKPPPIIVKFTSQKKRNEIYYKRKNIPQISDFEIPQMKELYINENLTNVRRSLLYEARKLKKIQGYNFVWTHMGDILARKNEKSKVLKICTPADLKKMC